MKELENIRGGNMTVKIQVIIAIIVIIALSIIVNMIRKKKIRIKICFGMVDCGCGNIGFGLFS